MSDNLYVDTVEAVIISLEVGMFMRPRPCIHVVNVPATTEGRALLAQVLADPKHPAMADFLGEPGTVFITPTHEVVGVLGAGGELQMSPKETETRVDTRCMEIVLARLQRAQQAA